MTNDRFGVLLACVLVVAVTPAFAQTFPVDDVSPPGEDTAPQALAVDPQGNAIVIWSLSGPTGSGGTVASGVALRAARYVAATDTWSPPVDLIRSPDPQHRIFNVAMDPAGNAIAVGFRDYFNGGGRGAREIIAARYSSGTDTWSPVTVIGPFIVELASVPEVVIDAAGNATVVWVQGSCFSCTGSAKSTYAARYSPATGWSTRVLAERVGTGYSPSFDSEVALDANGNALVTFARQNAQTGQLSIYTMRYAVSTATWDAEQLVAAPACSNFSSTTECTNAALAMDPQGNALLLWEGEPRGRLEGVRFNAATGVWSSLEQISSPGFRPGIAADMDGNFVVVWQTTSGSSIPPQVQARRYASSSGTWGPIVTLSDLGASGAQVVMDRDGNATAVWLRFTGSASTSRAAIQGARFLAAAGTWSGVINLTAPGVSLFCCTRLGVDSAGHVRIAWGKYANIYLSAGNGVVQSTRWLAGATVPGLPTLTGAVNGFTVTLSWTPPAIAASSYIIEAGSSPGGSNLFNGNVGSTTTISATVGAGTYYIRVRGVNAAGVDAPSNEVAVTVGPTCAVPNAPTVSGGVLGGTAAVSWPAVPGATRYILTAGTTQGGTQYMPATNLGTATGASASGLPSGFSAWVRVWAENACGQLSPPRDFFVN